MRAVGPVVAKDLKIATLVPEQSIWGKALRELDVECREATDGRVKLKIYPSGVAGDETDILRKIRVGQLHGALLSVAGLGEIVRSVQLFQVPLYLRSEEEAQYVLQKMDGAFRDSLEEEGYVLIHWIHGGWLNFFSTEPVRTVGDLKGLKQFVWAGDGSLAGWYEEAGLRPIPLALTDVLTGFKTGMIECVPTTPQWVLSLQWYRSAGNMLDYKVSPLFGGLVLSKRAWSKLSDADKQTLLTAGERAQTFLMEKVPELEREAVDAMRKRGLVVTEPLPARGAKQWTELSDHFAKRMLEAWVEPTVLRDVERHLQEFRSRVQDAGGKGSNSPPRGSGE
jgi:TRAP-type C4-dicarboxylate transport system substrate-binding protein